MYGNLACFIMLSVQCSLNGKCLKRVVWSGRCCFLSCVKELIWLVLCYRALLCVVVLYHGFMVNDRYYWLELNYFGECCKFAHISHFYFALGLYWGRIWKFWMVFCKIQTFVDLLCTVIIGSLILNFREKATSGHYCHH